MMNHVVIWQGQREAAVRLTEAIEQNKYPKMHIVCAPEERELFGGMPCHDLPCVSEKEEQQAALWTQTLQKIYLAVARETPAHTGPGAMVWNLVVSSAQSGHAYRILQMIYASAAKVPEMKFAIHVVVLLDRFSAYSREQEDLLLSLQRDVRRHHADEAALCWNRLSVLSDWSLTGAASPEIAQVRQDILCGVIAEVDGSLTELQFDCVTYGVQRTNFGYNDVSMLPRRVLYDKIKKSKRDAKATDVFFPDVNDVNTAMLEMLKEKRFPIISALLADDNNYKVRTSTEVLESFLERNHAMLLKGLNVEKYADQWLLAAKKQLALWIDVDEFICSYFQPEGMLESELDKKVKELDKECSAKKIKANFGSQISLRRRKKTARAMKELLAMQGVICFLKAIKERLPLLNDYLKKMGEVNAQFFGEDSNLVDAFSSTAYGQLLRQEADRFFLSSLGISDQETERYQTWLEKVLYDTFFSNIDNINDKKIPSEEECLEKARESAQEDKYGFVMLNPGYSKIGENEGEITCLGASTRLYILKLWSWDICAEEISGVLANVAIKETVREADLPLPPIGPKTKGKYVDMMVDLNRKEDHYVLRWHWPKGVSSLLLTVTNGSGETCFSDRVSLQMLTPAGEKIIPVSSLPQGECVCIRLEERTDMYTEENMYTEKEVQIPWIEQRLRMEKNRSILSNLSFSGRMQRLRVEIPEEIMQGIPVHNCILELHSGEYAFRYPIPEHMAEMVVLCEAGDEWTDARIVLEEK